MPQGLRTHFARRRHVITDRHEFVALVDSVAGSQVVLVAHGHVEILLVSLARLTLAGVEQLEDSRNLFGIGPNNIALSHRSDVEHFAGRFQRMFVNISVFQEIPRSPQVENQV